MDAQIYVKVNLRRLLGRRPAPDARSLPQGTGPGVRASLTR